MTERVVVGLDGSPGGDAALEWAADEAARRHARLTVVHVGALQDEEVLSPETARAVDAELGRHAQRLFARACAAATARHPELVVDAQHLTGTRSRALIDLSADTDLMVLGRRGVHNRFDALLGGVSHRVAAYAHCTVVIVPHHAAPATVAGVAPGGPATPATFGRVAVGIERGDGAAAALVEAFEHAARTGAGVLAVRAWGDVDWAYAVSNYNPVAAERWRLAAQHVLDSCVTPVAERYPQVPVTERLTHGSVAASLLDAAAESDLLVLGVRRTGEVGLSRLGWTATVLLAKSPCPVEIVQWPRVDDPPIRADRPAREGAPASPPAAGPPAASPSSAPASTGPDAVPARPRSRPASRGPR